MLPYEFLSDVYTHVFLSHNFGELLFKTKYLQPEVIWHNNVGWGNLSAGNHHPGYVYRTYDKIFLETGLQLNSLLKLNFMNLGYLGFGGGIFYRYGYYANSLPADNFAFKISLRYSIK